MNAEQLAWPWRHPETGAEFPPLIRMLQEAVATGTEHSRGGGSDPSTRSVVAVEALDLLRRIEHGVTQYGALPDGVTLEAWLRTLWAYAPFMHDAMTVWADDIWRLFEPPKTRAMRDLECPTCTTTRHDTSSGTVPAIRVTLDGDKVWAQCLNCDAYWSGWAGLVVLGMLAGTEPDVQAVTHAITSDQVVSDPQS